MIPLLNGYSRESKMNLNQPISYILLGLLTCITLSCDQSEKKEQPKTATQQNILDIEQLIKENIDSCNIRLIDSVLHVNIIYPPQALVLMDRTNLLVDSILLLCGEKLWNYKSATFHFFSDTSTKENREYFKMLEEFNGNNLTSTENCYFTRNLSDENLIKLSEKFNSKNYMRISRILLNECTFEELDDFQKCIAFAHSRYPDVMPENFIVTATNYGFKYDHNQNYFLEENAIKKLIELNEVYQEVGVHLNIEILRKILEPIKP
jgi:hypothetical protein